MAIALILGALSPHMLGSGPRDIGGNVTQPHTYATVLLNSPMGHLVLSLQETPESTWLPASVASSSFRKSFLVCGFESFGHNQIIFPPSLSKW